MSKKLRFAALALAAISTVAVSASLSACKIETKHPRATIQIEFNEKVYDLEYTLYRNMYPQTVRHFIELADEGFYNGMIIHNYTSSDWFTGAYSYDGETYAAAYENKSRLGEYLEQNDKEKAYYDLFASDKLTPNVYKTSRYEDGEQVVSREDALPNLIGEFPSNDHNVENNPLTEEYGSLKYFYYDKGSKNQIVTIKTSFDEILEHDYSLNCATSVFAIQASTTSSYTANSYCVFAKLRNESAEETLDDLNNDIYDYISDNHDGTESKFTTNVSAIVDKLDTFAEDGGRNIEASFYLTATPIIIKSVKITKY